jgi:cytochrome c
VNRRSLLTLIAAGPGALMARPARAYHGVRGNTFPNLKNLGVERQVRAIRHRDGAFRVETADGRAVEFLETQLRFKVDSSALGPVAGRPVILSTGEVGDHALVFFASTAEIGTFIEDQQ